MKLHAILSLTVLTAATSGCLLPDEMGDGESTVYKRQSSRRRAKYLPIGNGDRFDGGAKVPRGIGTQPDFAVESVLSVTEIESALKGLRKAYPDDVALGTTKIKTHEGRDIYFAAAGSSEPRVLLTSGVHPRERGGPDNIVYFVSDLLWANKNNVGLEYGRKKYDVTQVRQALQAGVAFIPSANPDGLHWDQTTNSCWRKNRRPRTSGREVGVDINRNFNVFWDYERLFDQRANVGIRMSKDPTKEYYIGPKPFSEPETRSINTALERLESLSWYLDLHSVLGRVLYAWGDDFAQVQDPSMSFTNATYDGQRGVLDDAYKEYMEPDDFESQKSVAERMVNAMNSAGVGRFYKAEEAAALYPALGSTDQAMAKYYGKTCGANRIHALTFEFGRKTRYYGDCQAYFYPDAAKYRRNLIQTNVGLMELMLSAAGSDGEKKVYECGTSQQGQQQPQGEPESPASPTSCREQAEKANEECWEQGGDTHSCYPKAAEAFKACQQRNQNQGTQ